MANWVYALAKGFIGSDACKPPTRCSGTSGSFGCSRKVMSAIGRPGRAQVLVAASAGWLCAEALVATAAFGQDAALATLSRAVRRHQPGRPRLGGG